jgi:hypothetical protein
MEGDVCWTQITIMDPPVHIYNSIALTNIVSIYLDDVGNKEQEMWQYMVVKGVIL